LIVISKPIKYKRKIAKKKKGKNKELENKLGRNKKEHIIKIYAINDK